MKKKEPPPQRNVPMMVGGASLSVGGIAAAAYSIFVWMLPGVDVGFRDHILVLVGMISVVVGIIIAAAGYSGK